MGFAAQEVCEIRSHSNIADRMLVCRRTGRKCVVVITTNRRVLVARSESKSRRMNGSKKRSWQLTGQPPFNIKQGRHTHVHSFWGVAYKPPHNAKILTRHAAQVGLITRRLTRARRKGVKPKWNVGGEKRQLAQPHNSFVDPLPSRLPACMQMLSPNEARPARCVHKYDVRIQHGPFSGPLQCEHSCAPFS